MRNFYNAIFFVVIIMGIATSCTSIKEDTELVTQEVNYRVSATDYKELLSTSNPRLVHIDVFNHTFPEQSTTYTLDENWDNNTFYSPNNKQKVTFSNSYRFVEQSQTQSTLMLTQKLYSDSLGSSNELPFQIDVVSPLPIHLISPFIEDCSTIPYCYYEDMEIQWNEDSNNNHGILVVIEWNGVMIGEENHEVHTIDYDFYPDNGVAILNNDLFNSVPNNALVRMYLIRANILNIETFGTDFDIEDINWEQFRTDFPELEHNCYTVAMGTAAIFDMIIVKNL